MFMMDMKQKIACELDRQFAEMGFATQGVEALRQGADVSLSTLYRYFPSREEMVVGALQYRDGVYFEWIAGGPQSGVEHVLHPIRRLGDWLHEVANTGCLFLNAMAAYPESEAVREAALSYKIRLIEEFRVRLCLVASHAPAASLAQSLYLIHEGVTDAARLLGPREATDRALSVAASVLGAERIN